MSNKNSKQTSSTPEPDPVQGVIEQASEANVIGERDAAKAGLIITLGRWLLGLIGKK